MSKKTKRYLMLLVAVGLIAVAAGGAGTFASFSAETANNGNYFATGTLFLHATKEGSLNTCKSEVHGGNLNIGANGCDLLFNTSQLTAGQTATVNLELANAGSINATAIKFALGSACADDKPAIATTSGISGGVVTTIPLSGLNQPLAAGTQIDVTDDTNTDTFTVATSVPSGASSVSVTGTSANTYASGSKVKLTATFGSANLCSGLLFYIQETDTGWSPDRKCVFGGGAGTTCAFAAQTVSGITTTLNNITPNLWGASTNSTALDAGNSRFFTIAIQAPASFTNAQQNAQATFDLRWHIES